MKLCAQEDTTDLYSTQAVSESIDCLLEALNAGFFVVTRRDPSEGGSVQMST